MVQGGSGPVDPLPDRATAVSADTIESLTPTLYQINTHYRTTCYKHVLNEINRAHACTRL